MIKSTNKKQQQTLISILIEYLTAVLFCHFMAIIFGAPLLDQFLQTLTFSVLMATLTLLPLISLIQHDSLITLVERLFIDRNYHNDYEYKFSTASISSVVGAWLGALVVPLDWDRWWQQWPIPNCLGAVAGYAFGIVISRKIRYSRKYSV